VKRVRFYTRREGLKGEIMMKSQILKSVFVVLASSLLVMAWAEEAPTIHMGEFFFAVADGPQQPFPPGTPPQSILTLTGGATGELEFVVENVGSMMHEFSGALLMIAEEVHVEVLDVEGNVVTEFAAPGLLELELAPGGMAEISIRLAEVIAESFSKDPELTMTFEVACHIPGHYEAGMRALITIAP
jgi:uncharacterized cupredoxin-like copper-binding protein